MNSGHNYYLLDHSGLIPQVDNENVGKYSIEFGDNDNYSRSDYDAKARSIIDSGISYSNMIPAKAGALLLKTDAASASKGWGIVYGGESLSMDKGSEPSAKIISFVQPKKEVSDLNAAFKESAAKFRMGSDFLAAANKMPVADNSNDFVLQRELAA